MEKEIKIEQIETLRTEFLSNAKRQAIQMGMEKNGILASAEKPQAQVANTPVFSLELETGEVTNQKQSGRCWMFAALNTFRHHLADKFKLADCELSQNYTFFWDKFEKANYFYENILSTANEPLTSRKVAFLLQMPQQDGGQWDMLVDLIKKYGVVPKAVMPETQSSSNSRELNELLNQKLRKDAVLLRKLVAEKADQATIYQAKAEMLSAIYTILASALGTPPTIFDFSYRDDDKNYHRDADLTPQQFYEKYVGLDLDNYVSLINAPTADKPYNRSYTVEMLGSVVGGKPVRYLNVDMETMKKLTIAQLERGESVWFGSDVGQSSNRKSGIMAGDMYAFANLFDADFSMTKAERLDYGESMMTHAMVLTGVDLVAGQPTKWKVENSWGEKVGTKGYFIMDDKWMDEFTYQVVIHKDLLSAEQLAAYEADPICLAPWDPMGALA